LAQAQGGHIEVASSPRSGSTFTVILLAAPAA
jgi:signal transduction histidine kinase